MGIGYFFLCCYLEYICRPEQNFYLLNFLMTICTVDIKNFVTSTEVSKF